MREYFASKKAVLRKHASDPDAWKYDDADEAHYHYLDIDALEPYPFNDFPRDLEEAYETYGEDRVKTAGELPWRIEAYVQTLTEDFSDHRWKDAVFTASVLGHYVADLHQPLHVTENHDGQLTGNEGIHSHFESGLVERYGDGMVLQVSSAVYVRDVFDFCMKAVRSGYPLVEEIMEADTSAGQRAGGNEERYYAELHRAVGKAAERRMGEASSGLASLIYTAWVNAKKPIPPTKP